MIVPGDARIDFRLNEFTRRRILELPVAWGHPGLSEVTFRRTYSRTRPDGTTEDWGDVVVRVVEGQFSILKTHAAQNRIPWSEERGQRLAAEAATRMHAFKWTPPGRGLWMCGTDYVWERGGAALNNCAFVSTRDFSPDDPEETIAPFTFLMDAAMLGIGPGFDVRGAGKVGVPGPAGAPLTWHVDDSREGWVAVVGAVIRSWLFGGPPIVPDVRDVRPEGSPLRGFGGVASGPGPLVQGIAGIEDRLRARLGRDLDSVTIVDVMNLIGKIVVAGNVRRTAEIGFGAPDDLAFRTMKNHDEHPVATGGAPPDELREECLADYEAYAEHQFQPATGVARRIAERYAARPWAYKFGGWRWASNNTIFATVGMDYAPLNAPIAQAGEPGLAWLETMRSHGRLRDPADYRDHRVEGGNPCLEQSLESYEMCNLVENYPSHADDYWDFQRSLKFSYLYAKTVTLMGTHVERTNAVMARNRRIGCSMSGIQDAIARVGRTEFFRGWCDRGYAYVGYLDRKYSDWLGVRESVKKTSVKPSGTVSLVAGVFGAGAHRPKATGYRLVRLAVASPAARVLRRAGYRVEPAVAEPTRTVVAYFPWIVPDEVTTEDDVGLWEQVKDAVSLQHWWADNQVSCTASFTAEEAERGEIARVLTAHDGELKGISFLRKSDTGYAQMPFTRAPREEVAAYAARLGALDWSEADASGEEADTFCDGAACAVRA
jgi:ribonucleoside-triphosphate reductase